MHGARLLSNGGAALARWMRVLAEPANMRSHAGFVRTGRMETCMCRNGAPWRVPGAGVWLARSLGKIPRWPAQGLLKPGPLEARTRICLAPRGDVLVSGDVLYRVVLTQGGAQAGQGLVLCGLELCAFQALELDAVNAKEQQTLWSKAEDKGMSWKQFTKSPEYEAQMRRQYFRTANALGIKDAKWPGAAPAAAAAPDTEDERARLRNRVKPQGSQ